jgi:hypothetical protein
MNHEHPEGPVMPNARDNGDLAGFRDWLMALARAQVPVDLRGASTPPTSFRRRYFTLCETINAPTSGARHRPWPGFVRFCGVG